MTREDFQELTDKTEKLSSLYMNNTDKKIIITELEWINEYPYKLTKLDGLVTPLSLGITDRYFGGQASKAAKVKDKPFYILANKLGGTVGILIKNEDLPKLSYNELQKLAIKYKLKCGSRAKKEEIIEELLTVK
jgi:hypothetical protein